MDLNDPHAVQMFATKHAFSRDVSRDYRHHAAWLKEMLDITMMQT
jgi:hypothetical protein